MLDQLLRDFVDFMDGTSWMQLAVLVVCIQPFVALVHELGHALAALARLPGQVVIRIGASSPLVTFRSGRLAVLFHPLIVPWRFDCVCGYEDDHESRADAVLIALAGPAVSVATGAVAWWALRATSGDVAVDALLGLFAFGSFATAVVCLVPMTLTDVDGVRFRTDGACALDALR